MTRPNSKEIKDNGCPVRESEKDFSRRLVRKRTGQETNIARVRELTHQFGLKNADEIARAMRISIREARALQKKMNNGGEDK